MANVPEIWKQYDKRYWVSDQGRVKSVRKNGTVHYLTPVRRDAKDKNFRIKMNNKYVSLRRLVWETFNGKIPDGYGVITKNGCGTMNELYNLKIVPMYNAIIQNNKSKMKKVIDLDTGIVYPSVRYAADKLFLSHSTVTYCCQNKWKTKMYNLEFFDEDKEYKINLRFIRG